VKEEQGVKELLKNKGTENAQRGFTTRKGEEIEIYDGNFKPHQFISIQD